MQQKRSIWFFLLVLGLAFLSVAIATPVFEDVPGLNQLHQKPRLGLDINGGFRFTLRADRSKLTREQLSQWDQVANNTLRILEARAQQALGVVEASVVRKGADRFIVELPGFTDEDSARDVLKTSARLEYYWAKNVVTEYAQFRPYEVVDAPEGSDSEVYFRRKGSEELIKPGTPEWDEVLKGWELIISGEHLRFAAPQLREMTGTYSIRLGFDAEGARKLDDFARRVYNKRENLAAVMDKKVISFAHIKDGVDRFPGGEAILEGNFTAQAANRLVSLLQAGAIPVDLIEEDVTRISPSIGFQALEQIKLAGIISFIVIALFLVIYYLFAGFVALLALGCYTLFCFAAFVFLGVTFSLAAIAGFILSIGMAVDANILIFERLKEELRGGRTLLTAIDLGFKRAFPAIIDSNTCTILTSLVLMNIGTGPVKGFATTLIIGVLISLFTAITVTRSLLLAFVHAGIGRNPNLYGMKRGWFGERLEARANENPLRIIERMKLYFVISGLIIVPGVIFWALGGIKPNVEFLGGVESVVRLKSESPTTPRELAQLLEKGGVHGANVKVTAGEKAGEIRAYVTLSREENPELAKLLASPSTEEKLEARRRIVQAIGSDASFIAQITLPLPTGTNWSTESLIQKLTQGGFKNPEVSLKTSDGKTTASILLPLSENKEIDQLLSSKKPDGTTKTNDEQSADRQKITEKLVKVLGISAETLQQESLRITKSIKDELEYGEASPTVRRETIMGAIYGVSIASALIVFYLALRFGVTLGGFAKGLRFGVSAIIAMLHDALVVLGLSAITGYFLGWEISQLTITAILTVIGFSVHDTIVIFDRIRENLRRPFEGENFEHLVNRSITQTFARSINTSFTVILTLIILVAIGSATPDLRHFNLAMLVGILSGTYSSIFNASPILVLWERIVMKKKGFSATIMGDERLRDREVEKRPRKEEERTEKTKFSPTRRKR
ncbi:MAG TPA: protein translocase subunit SecD [Fimbriimonadales bacterium]|nr:protein translocase subunit SecD [Fimbriimonadales bacterium]